MKRLYLTGIAAAVALTFAMGASAADKKTAGLRRQRRLRLLEAAEAGVKKAQGELPNYTLAVQVSRAGRRRDPAAR